MNGFLQTQPELPDAWAADRVLRETIQWMLGEELFEEAEPHLAAMGQVAVAPETLALAARAEREPPVHVPFGAWGHRIDEIRVSDAYTALGRIGIAAGVTALPYEEGPYGDRARVVWAGVLSLWGPSSALYSCPVAMTDGAARTLLEHGGPEDMPVVDRLTTRDPGSAWTSGQWMTETAGGSDVGRTGTIARRGDDGVWRLYGTKWFTSATTSEIALALARPEGAPAGSGALALFQIRQLRPDGRRNNITVRRLKDKLGTRALPTAELELEGTIATPVGDPLDGGGIRRMATMLNITRLHNAIGSSSALGRGLAWARAYARVREVFGRPLSEMPAHQATLADLAVDYDASVALSLRCAELMGRAERGGATTEESSLLRALTPVAKLVTARWAIAGVTEAMEAVGGVGYCEDSTIPALVRNTHVNPIWEGTTNVLALDLLRVARRSDALSALLEDAERLASAAASGGEASDAAGEALRCVRILRRRVARAVEEEEGEALARALAVSIGRTYACALLCARGSWAAARGDMRTASTAHRMAARGLLEVEAAPDPALALDDVASEHHPPPSRS